MSFMQKYVPESVISGHCNIKIINVGNSGDFKNENII